MALAPALRAAIAVFRTRASGLLPAYFLTPAVPAMARVVGFVGLFASYLYLSTTGRMAAFREELSGFDTNPPDPEAEPEAFAEWAEGLLPILELLLPETVVGILLATAVVSLVVFLLLYAAITAAQLAACRGTLADERGTTAAIEGTRRHWLTMLGLLLFELFLWGVLTVGAVIVAAVSVIVVPLFGILIGLLVFFLWFLSVLAVRAVFAFAPVSAVVDGTGFEESLCGAVAFIRSNPADAFGYYLIAFGVFAIIGGISAIPTEAAAPLVGVLMFLIVAPSLDLLKTALYGQDKATLAPPATPDYGLLEQFRAGLGKGWAEMAAFVRERPGLHLLSLALLVGGFAVGWMASAPYEGLVTASIEARLEDHFAPAATITFGTNNWAVAVSTAFGGLAATIPAVVALLFNGFALGAFARLEAELPELVAFIIPHGIFEIPGIIIGGALGLFLGIAAVRTYQGRRSRERLADDLERAFWVLVGVGILMAIAAVIEGFISPYYAEWLGMFE